MKTLFYIVIFICWWVSWNLMIYYGKKVIEGFKKNVEEINKEEQMKMKANQVSDHKLGGRSGE